VFDSGTAAEAGENGEDEGVALVEKESRRRRFGKDNRRLSAASEVGKKEKTFSLGHL
jgi:hypothetical protein